MDMTIHRPDSDQHFMVLRPIQQRVVVRLPNGQKLADSEDAIRLMESGRTLYDPVIYLPRRDLTMDLVTERGESKCPLKGTATYYGVEGYEKLAWSYREPLSFATAIRDLVAFYPNKVIIEEHPIRDD
ncbi:MAG: DUF427 domain-containing protein [Hyphomicrobiales bacterium]|nr:DUF427 domain-containing protein [Hyphomicrobiales bacterium]